MKQQYKLNLMSLYVRFIAILFGVLIVISVINNWNANPEPSLNKLNKHWNMLINKSDKQLHSA